MKQTLAFIMATAMLACTLSMTTFAATEIKYPVDDISSRAYVADDEGDLYLTSDTDKVSYGKTAYFPLLSDGAGAVSTAKTEWEKAKAEQVTANNAYTAAQTAYNTANNALKAYDDAVEDLEEAQGNLNNYNEKDEAVTTATTNRDNAKTAHDQAVAALAAKAWETATPPIDSGEWPTYLLNAQNKEIDTQRILGEQEAALTIAIQARDALGNPTTLQNAVTSAEAIVKTKKGDLLSATNKSEVSDARTAVTVTLKKAMDDAADDQTTAANKVTTTYETYVAAQNNTYKYVYETDAVKSVKISKKWEEGGSYVSDVDVVKKRVRSDIPGATSSMQYIYFLAIKIKSSTSTQDRDLFGTVTLKKSGSNGFEVSTDISLEIGYSSASDTDVGEGVIPKTPATFKKGDGFDEDDEFEFEFEADGDSYFMVDTRGQGSIVLGFDTEYDEDISDEYPDADLWFYNGNYASFNRVGDLFLSYPNDDGYVYEISKSGDLTRISPDYDEYEDAYRIRTRTLGRYVISDTRLSVTSRPSSSSSSSGSGTGTGTGTGGTGTAVVPTAPSTPSYTYTPPAASSSTAPPAQSSSEPEEEEEEEESEPEELEDEDDDIVEVVVDDQEAEGPEEKSGIPAWVWAMIIVGLAAVPVAIGVVYYLHSRPLRRDFFNKGDDEYDDDYDDDDEE